LGSLTDLNFRTPHSLALFSSKGPTPFSERTYPEITVMLLAVDPHDNVVDTIKNLVEKR
jgi:hypothetical protein